MAFFEPTLGYHPCDFECLTLASESTKRTQSGGQFDWGGRLPKSNGGAQRSTHGEWKPPRERKGISWLNCERDLSSRDESRRGGLAPRCRLVASWGCSRSQGLVCSPIKAVRELGSKRRETVWSLSTTGARYLRGAAPSTRGPEWTYHWCICCGASRISRVAKYGPDNR